MPALPSVVSAAAPSKPSPAPEKLAAIARAREAQAAWGELGADCAAVMSDIRAQLASLRSALVGYVAALEARDGNGGPTYELLRRDRKAIIAATSALAHLDGAVARLRDREAREARRAAEKAAGRVRRAKGRAAEQPEHSCPKT